MNEQESKLVVQGLAALCARLRSKVKNDLRNGRNDFKRVTARSERIKQAEELIIKLSN